MVSWYYVDGSDRVGPVSESDLSELVTNGKLNDESYVWKKGFDNWIHLKEVSELSYILNGDEIQAEESSVDEIPEIDMGSLSRGVDWDSITPNARVFMIKIGHDRGINEAEYGPYTMEQLKRAFNENRINERTFIFVHGMENWCLLADLPIFEKVFQVLPPALEETEKRVDTRKPFVARLLFHDQKEVFEGICRDISVGGMQILVSDFPGIVGEEVTLNVHPENNDVKFTAIGKIVRLLDGNQGFSIRFSQLNTQAKECIDSYVQES